jgi:hypothetical protein
MTAATPRAPPPVARDGTCAPTVAPTYTLTDTSTSGPNGTET